VRNETKSERKDIGSGSEGKKSSETRKPMKHRSSVAHLPYLTNQEDPPASLLHLPLSAEAGNTPLVSPWPTLRFLSHTQSNRQKNVERETKKAASFVVSGLPSSSIFAERAQQQKKIPSLGAIYPLPPASPSPCSGNNFLRFQQQSNSSRKVPPDASSSLH
jgi:hypothetical protein